LATPIVPPFPRLTIVIDGKDECRDTNQRGQGYNGPLYFGLRPSILAKGATIDACENRAALQQTTYSSPSDRAISTGMPRRTASSVLASTMCPTEKSRLGLYADVAFCPSPYPTLPDLNKTDILSARISPRS